MITDWQLEFFDARIMRGEAMVLATVYDTRGSTYSKPGDQLLIDSQGVFRGLLSGGCLEGDLAVRAQVVLESGRAQTASYDFTADDEIWGLGVGCEGLMQVFLQPLVAEQDWQPFRAIANAAAGGQRVAAVTVIESALAALQPGASSVVTSTALSGVDALRPLAEQALLDRATRYRSIEIDGTLLQVLVRVVEPPPQLLILGAGLDAEPVLRFAHELGWRCTISDHRPQYLQSGNFGVADTHCIPAGQVAATLCLSNFDFALVMSHHLPSDRAYLKQLAKSDIGYVGLLGPRARRERLLADLGSDGHALRERLHGPVGLNIGGRGPAPIALSVIAEMQSLLPSVR